MKPKRNRKAIWVTLCLLIAVAMVVAGSIAGNKEDGPSRPHASAPSAGQVAEEEFERNLRYEVAEEQLQEEGFSQGEAEEIGELAKRERVGGRGAIELGGIAKNLPGSE